jgi:hypothetical protein
MVTGIVLSSAGLVALIAGSGLMAQPDYNCDCAYIECDCGSDKTGATVLLIVGGLAAAGGIPLIIIGARKVPAEPAAKEATTALLPAIGVGPGSATLRWTF